MSAGPPNGTVMALARNDAHGFSKQPQVELHLLAGEGIEGDAHRGSTVQHLYLKRRGPTAPNLAQVHLFASEMLAELAAKGFVLGLGEIGENILTVGLELLDLPEGTRLCVGAGPVLEVTGLRTPCSQIDRFRKGLQKHLWGERVGRGQRTRRAGIMSIVLQGGVIRPGDTILPELPPLPHRPLGPV